MNLFGRAIRSCFRKPVKSLLLLLAVCMISLLFLSGMAKPSVQDFYWNIIQRTEASG